MKRTIMLLVTYKCNLHCSYCYEPKNAHKKMSVSTAKRVLLDKLTSLDDGFDSIEIHFMGGEPLLEYPFIVEICEWLWNSDLYKRREIIFFAPTNGTLLNEDMKEWFSKNRERVILGLSFDGDHYMQDVNRSNSSSYVDLSFFTKIWPQQSVKMTVSPDTIGYLFEGVQYLQQRGFDNVSADLAMGDNVLWKTEHLMIFKQELSKFVEFYTKNPDTSRFSMFGINVADIMKPNPSTPIKCCSCGESLVCIDCDGIEYGCHLFSPISIDYAKAQYARTHINFKNHSIFESASCKQCALNQFCNRCCGMNYICTGDVSKPLPFHCSAIKLIFAANCRLQLNIARDSKNEMVYKQIMSIINKLK